ncbi:transketolase [Candidatus Pacearchaeota archaeon]|jgi:transketolase|nr:transketolase [Candidatus Pacearchaeota archaeon]|tara:strand:- start:11133 stop:11981 length:849 start_codon:yes stop_codon:yes gene_type:complete
MEKEQIIKLQRKANDLRKDTLNMCIEAGTGHVTSSFSCAEILTTLYSGNILNYKYNNPEWDERDRFILSKGQASPILYVALTNAGFFSKDWLKTFCKKDAKFGVHLQNTVPGVEYSTGSLGHGLGLGTGVALRAKIDKKNYHTFVLLGDAELHEGSNWESAMFASSHNLNNLTAIVDRNGYGVLGATENIVKLNPLEKKFKSFGWDVKTIDGHSVKEIYEATNNFRGYKEDKPLMIIAETVKGKGIKSWENKALVHGMAPKGKDIKKLEEELEVYSSRGEYE